MKNILLVLAIALLPFSAVFGQISILLVDDSDDGFNHVEDFATVLDSLGYAYSLFDAQGTATVPTLSDLQPYDLVIWHAGADLDSLAFWSFADTTNPALSSYLAGGGNMWAIGTDLLFDRYGGSATFAPGSLAWDYLGMQSYDVQSYVDDSASGVPLMNAAASSPITGLPQLDWIFSTLWYVDGVTPINGGGVSIYEMGPASYIFSGKTSGVWYDNGTSKVLSFLFNPSQISTFQKHKDMTEAVLGYFQSQIVGINDILVAESAIALYPNPASNNIRIQFITDAIETGQVQVFSMIGAEVIGRSFVTENGLQEISIPLDDLAAGNYLVRLKLAGKSEHKVFVKQ